MLPCWKDEPAQIKGRIAEGLVNEAVHAIIITGGTGISKRDQPLKRSTQCSKNGGGDSASSSST